MPRLPPGSAWLNTLYFKLLALVFRKCPARVNLSSVHKTYQDISELRFSLPPLVPPGIVLPVSVVLQCCRHHPFPALPGDHISRRPIQLLHLDSVQ
jgi:hypothetical protein